MSKHCLNCDKELSGKYTLKFCNHSCAAVYNNKSRCIINNCFCCNKGLRGKNRKFCNSSCQGKYKYEKIKELILSDKAHLLKAKNKDGIIKKVLIEKYGNACMKCGWSEINKYTGKVPIELEHIDGYWYNCKLNNLLLLCPNCHSLTKTYKALNKGNGRPWRYEFIERKKE